MSPVEIAMRKIRFTDEQQPFAAVAFNDSDAAGGIADMRKTSTFGENV